MRTAVVRWISLFAATVALSPVAAQPGQGLSLRPDADPWTSRLQGRLSLSTSTPSWLSDAEPASLRGVSLMGDYYLTGSLFGERRSGGLRATSALLVGPRWQAFGAGALGLPSGSGLVIERRLPAVTPDSEGSLAAPYVGIGYSGQSSRGGFSFSADLGIVALGSGSVRFGRALPSSVNLDDAVRDLRLSPMLQLGVSYSF
jgi:hypothetical protein